MLKHPRKERQVKMAESPSQEELSFWDLNPSKPKNQPIPGTLSASFRPLAARMRPQALDDFIGQHKILAPGRPLRLWLESNRIPSLIFWGPPGCGKTSLAHLIAQHSQAQFEPLSAVLSGVKELKEAVARAKQRQQLHQTKTILFLDEIHRFNKAQQDALLPHVEEGSITLIGATTENPSFEVNAALLSRCKVIRLESLSVEELVQVLRNALNTPERGLQGKLSLSEEALHWIAEYANGDARQALTLLENITFSSKTPISEPLTPVQIQNLLQEMLEKRPIFYDKKGEEHYNVISAFIKSLRGSDPQAGLYYLARMLEAGEDPKFIVRRLVIFASEDIGNADPQGLVVAVAAQQAVDFVGLPEARINLAQAVTYLALAPKSNASYRGIESALEEVRKSGALPVPFHLRNPVTGLMKADGYGKGYQYAHNSPSGMVKQVHLPDALRGRKFYQPKEIAFEKTLKSRLEDLEKLNTQPERENAP